MRWILSAFALTAGCYLQHGLEAEDPPIATPTPTPTPAPFAPEVLASISSVMLGDDCGDGVDADGGDAEADRDGAGGGVGDCAVEDGCWAPCQQTAMQLLFDVRRIADPLEVEILRVRLRDYETREVYDELTWRSAKHWTDDGYVAWDEWLREIDTEQTSYDLSAPEWERIGGGDYWATYGMTFVLEVEVRIGEEVETLWSDPLNRAPDIDT